jgi:hypothetical protein
MCVLGLSRDPCCILLFAHQPQGQWRTGTERNEPTVKSVFYLVEAYTQLPSKLRSSPESLSAVVVLGPFVAQKDSKVDMSQVMIRFDDIEELAEVGNSSTRKDEMVAA